MSKNSYESDAKRKETSQWLQNIENTASDRKLPMGKRVKKGAGSAAIKLVAGISGGFAGAAMGRWSILGGILATGTGEVIGSPELTSFGVGMMASNLIPAEGLGATEEKKSGFAKMKDRMKTYGKGIMQKFYLDKVIKKKPTTATTTQTATTTANTTTTQSETTSGIGEVQYFKYPQSEPDEMDLRELEKYENEIKKSAETFVQENETSAEKLSGVDENLLGDEDRIY